MELAVAIPPNVTDWMSALGTDFAAIGTVAALIFLGIQASLLSRQTLEIRRQSEGEAKARREDADRSRMEFRSEHTPFLSVEADRTEEVVDEDAERHYLAVTIKLHADGGGVAHNAIVKLWKADLSISIATTTISYLRAPDRRSLILVCPLGLEYDETPTLRLEVSFLNMFNELVRLNHSARFRLRQFEITDAPVYEWPWTIP